MRWCRNDIMFEELVDDGERFVREFDEAFDAII